jgi:hypothetical protein
MSRHPFSCSSHYERINTPSIATMRFGEELLVPSVTNLRCQVGHDFKWSLRTGV